MTAFDITPTLIGPRLTLRPLEDADRPGLYSAASDPAIWAQHPATERHRREVFDPYFNFLLAAGGTLAVRQGETIIGCSRFYPVPDHPGDWGIGFTFLDRAHWGGGWNREMKALMIAHVLAVRDRVWFHIAPGNLRSQIATTRLGAVFAYDAELDLGTGPALNKCYTLTAAGWEGATGVPL